MPLDSCGAAATSCGVSKWRLLSLGKAPAWRATGPGMRTQGHTLPPTPCSGDEAALSTFSSFFHGKQLDKGTEVALLWRAGGCRRPAPLAIAVLCTRACRAGVRLASGLFPGRRPPGRAGALTCRLTGSMSGPSRLASFLAMQTAPPTCACARPARPLPPTPAWRPACPSPPPAWATPCGRCTSHPARPRPRRARPGWRRCARSGANNERGMLGRLPPRCEQPACALACGRNNEQGVLRHVHIALPRLLVTSSLSPWLGRLQDPRLPMNDTHINMHNPCAQGCTLFSYTNPTQARSGHACCSSGSLFCLCS